MYKILVNGQWVECDSPAAVAALTDYLNRQKRAEDPASVAGPVNGTHFVTFKTAVGPSEKEEVDQFINNIKEFVGTVINSQKMKEILDADTLNGVGPSLRALSRRFERIYQFPLDEILEREARPGQPTVWRVKGDGIRRIRLFQ